MTNLKNDVTSTFDELMVVGEANRNQAFKSVNGILKSFTVSKINQAMLELSSKATLRLGFVGPAIKNVSNLDFEEFNGFLHELEIQGAKANCSVNSFKTPLAPNGGIYVDVTVQLIMDEEPVKEESTIADKIVARIADLPEGVKGAFKTISALMGANLSEQDIDELLVRADECDCPSCTTRRKAEEVNRTEEEADDELANEMNEVVEEEVAEKGMSVEIPTTPNSYKVTADRDMMVLIPNAKDIKAKLSYVKEDKSKATHVIKNIVKIIQGDKESREVRYGVINDELSSDKNNHLSGEAIRMVCEAFEAKGFGVKILEEKNNLLTIIISW